MEHMHQIMAHFMVYFEKLGDIGLFILAFIESSVFLIPPDFMMIPMCLAKPQNALYYATIATIGSTLGGGFGYAIGKFGGRPALDFLFKKQQDKILMVEKLYNKYGVWAVAAAAFTPIPYKIFTIASGVFKMNFWGFMLVSFLGRGARFFLVATTLMIFGEKIKSNIELVIIAVSILVVAFYVIAYKSRHLIKKDNKNQKTEEKEDEKITV